MKSIIEQRLREPDVARLYAEESLVIDVLEEICAWMDRQNVTRADLARRLKTSRANVTQMLNGRNVSLRTLAAVVHVLGGELRFRIKDKIPASTGTSNIVRLYAWSNPPSYEIPIIPITEEQNRTEEVAS